MLNISKQSVYRLYKLVFRCACFAFSRKTHFEDDIKTVEFVTDGPLSGRFSIFLTVPLDVLCTRGGGNDDIIFCTTILKQNQF